MDYMKIRRSILTLPGLFALLGLLAPAWGAFFPAPDPTAQWDMLFGDIMSGTFAPGSQVAAWDEGGTLRFRADILTDAVGPFYNLTEFYGPPTGSTDPFSFTWQIFDGLTLWSATIHSTNWTAWIGEQDSFNLNLDLDQPLRVIPEPATLLVFGLLGGSGLIAGLKKKGWLKI